MFPAPPGQPLLSLTAAAVTHLKSRATPREDFSCVRIDVKQGGCAGMEYTMEFAAEPSAMDEVIEQDGVRLAVAPTATLFLVGTEIDYRTGLLESGFEFRNPNVSESCGCGESVKFTTAADSSS